MRVYRLYIYIVCLFLVLLSLSQNNRCFFVGKAKQRFEICDKKNIDVIFMQSLGISDQNLNTIYEIFTAQLKPHLIVPSE